MMDLLSCRRLDIDPTSHRFISLSGPDVRSRNYLHLVSNSFHSCPLWKLVRLSLTFSSSLSEKLENYSIRMAHNNGEPFHRRWEDDHRDPLASLSFCECHSTYIPELDVSFHDWTNDDECSLLARASIHLNRCKCLSEAKDWNWPSAPVMKSAPWFRWSADPTRLIGNRSS